jgi:hypothetical protein
VTEALERFVEAYRVAVDAAEGRTEISRTQEWRLKSATCKH